jgi:hypothetical protein
VKWLGGQIWPLERTCAIAPLGACPACRAAVQARDLDTLVWCPAVLGHHLQQAQ